MNDNQQLEKLFQDKGLGPENLTGRITLLVDLLGVESVRSSDLRRRRGYETCQVDLKKLPNLPADILSSMYGDLCQLYGELGITKVTPR